MNGEEGREEGSEDSSHPLRLEIVIESSLMLSMCQRGGNGVALSGMSFLTSDTMCSSDSKHSRSVKSVSSFLWNEFLLKETHTYKKKTKEEEALSSFSLSTVVQLTFFPLPLSVCLWCQLFQGHHFTTRYSLQNYIELTWMFWMLSARMV